MAVALADLSNRVENPVTVSSKTIYVLIVHECPLFRVGLRSLLERQDDCQLVGEAAHLEDVLALAREHRPDIVLLDGGLTTADPLDIGEDAQSSPGRVPGDGRCPACSGRETYTPRPSSPRRLARHKSG